LDFDFALLDNPLLVMFSPLVDL